MTKQLNEGLYEGDLESTVDPTIIMDYYKPKFGDEKRTLVMTFACNDEGPANDLNEFIQKGSYDIIDSDTSPAPDTVGKYLVFVEMVRNRKMFNTIDKILNSCSAITSNGEWKFIPYTYVEKFEWNKKNFEKTVPQMPHLYGHDLTEEERIRIQKRIQFLNKY
jgi:hypothetical protein